MSISLIIMADFYIKIRKCQVEMYKNNNDMTPFFFNFGTFIIDLTQNKHYSNFG